MFQKPDEEKSDIFNYVKDNKYLEKFILANGKMITSDGWINYPTEVYCNIAKLYCGKHCKIYVIDGDFMTRCYNVEISDEYDEFAYKFSDKFKVTNINENNIFNMKGIFVKTEKDIYYFPVDIDLESLHKLVITHNYISQLCKLKRFPKRLKFDLKNLNDELVEKFTKMQKGELTKVDMSEFNDCFNNIMKGYKDNKSVNDIYNLGYVETQIIVNVKNNLIPKESKKIRYPRNIHSFNKVLPKIRKRYSEYKEGKKEIDNIEKNGITVHCKVYSHNFNLKCANIKEIFKNTKKIFKSSEKKASKKLLEKDIKNMLNNNKDIYTL